MTEGLVALETAKPLKAAGFKEDANSLYELVYKGGGGPEYGIDESYDARNYNTDVCSVSAPAQSIAQRRLRETGNLHIGIYRSAVGYGHAIAKADNGTWQEDDDSGGTNDGGLRDTCEEALEAGIQEASRLIWK